METQIIYFDCESKYFGFCCHPTFLQYLSFIQEVHHIGTVPNYQLNLLFSIQLRRPSITIIRHFEQPISHT